MGGKTYRQLTTELFPEEWVYSNLMTYVITTKKQETLNYRIQFKNMSPSALIKQLKKENGKDIWICGGASIINQIIKMDEIDRYHINVIPTILGDGIRLFEQLPKQQKLHLLQTKSYNGITDLVYERR